MSTSILRKPLTAEYAHRIHKELHLNNQKQLLKFYRIEKDRISVPYYYGKFLRAVSEYDNGHDVDFLKVFKKIDTSGIAINKNQNHSLSNFEVSFTLNNRQKDIVGELVGEILKEGSAVLKACTGFGKSIVAMHLACQLGLRTLIYVTRTQFYKQLESAFKSETNAILWIPSSKKSKMPTNVDVIICTPKKWKYMTPEVCATIGTVIIDEAPLVCTAQSIGPLLSVKPRYLTACSATFKRRDGMEVMLDYMCGPKVFVKNLDTPVRCILWRTGIHVPYYRGIKGVDWTKHVAYLASHQDRNEMIADFANKLIHANDPNAPEYTSSVAQCIRYLTNDGKSNGGTNKIIAITGNVKDHIQHLPPLLTKKGLTCDYLSAKKQKYEDSNVLLGTSNRIGIGFDEKSGCKSFNGVRINIVMQLVSCATESLAAQIIGRAARADTAIVVCLVDNNNISRRHFENAIKGFLGTLDDVEIVEYNGDPRIENGKASKLQKSVPSDDFDISGDDIDDYYIPDEELNYDMDSSE